MNLRNINSGKKVFSGEVYGVQLPGITGLFEVLDKHAPLVSALKAGKLKVLKDKSNHLAYYDIQSGFVEVLNNKATVWGRRHHRRISCIAFFQPESTIFLLPAQSGGDFFCA